ncbi:MAG: hypothetical protein ACRDZ4_19640 [Egibacteraceae bacterium]
MDVELRREPLDGPSGRRLIAALLAEERAHYGSESHGLTALRACLKVVVGVAFTLETR